MNVRCGNCGEVYDDEFIKIHLQHCRGLKLKETKK